jgi:hypoxanthine phosphoribosyltransferase
MGLYTFLLARQILESGNSYDRLVPLAKGGLTWVRELADLLKIDAVSTTRIKSYNGVGSSTPPRILQPLADPVAGEKVLIFDEVVDTGETIRVARQYLGIMGAANIGVAALCYKPHSSFKPDYFAFETSGWVVFPHEIREFIDESRAAWTKNGLTNPEITNRLLTIGLPAEQVDYFMNLKVK